MKEKFDKLKAVWKQDTAHLSNITTITNHWAYLEIISLGKEVVPLMLEDLKTNGPEFWFWALTELTGYMPPIKHEDRGRIQLISDLWVQWGIDNGYITG